MFYLNIREEELKNKVGKDWFENFDTTKIIGNVDFCVTFNHKGKQDFLFEEDTRSLLWAEAKKGSSNIYTSIVQLILTIGKARTFDKELPPAYLGAFDAEKIAFIPYNSVQEVFYQNDFNWNVTPSNHETKEFKQILERVEKTISEHSLLFRFGQDDADLKEFIKKNFVPGKSGISKILVDKNNFISIYNKWLQQVKPSIAANWDSAKKFGIIDGDFYLADLLSKENETLKEKLFVLLKKNYYEFDRIPDETGFFSSKTTNFYDNQKAHTSFWNKYERPPKEEYWDYIVERRDLLVPQDVRERKGSFFTPQIWVEKSQEYLTSVLGENWQDEYYIWDCAAGTGNLLTGLTNKYNIYASTLDKQDVDVMHQRIETMNQNSVSGNGANLLQDHVFQFDFLNDSFDDPKVPKSLQDILKDPEKRKKLVIYINPPYAEVSSVGIKGKAGVNQSKTHDKYIEKLGTAGREIYTQFIARIYDEINGCILGEFSTQKVLQGSAFDVFRNFFQAKLEKCFIVPANTFDNVKGSFPIGFKVWNTNIHKKFKQIMVDVYDSEGVFLNEKLFYMLEKGEFINKWISSYKFSGSDIGFLAGTNGNDFQQNNIVYILNKKDQMANPRGIWINENNLIPTSIYLSVRQVFEATWLNDRDQFLYPNKGWETDTEFQNNCLAYTLFHGQNKISSKQGVNNFIPFTEQEVNARERFESHFMTNFIGGKLGNSVGEGSNLEKKDQGISSRADEIFESNNNFVPTSPLQFSEEAIAVFDAGRELWRYYHEVCGENTPPLNRGTPSDTHVVRETRTVPVFQEGNFGRGYNPNASLYDIREYFQGRNENGKMNNKSQDEEYSRRVANLRSSLKVLALKIQPKVYEYGFLKG